MSKSQISGAISLDVSGVSAAVAADLAPVLEGVRQEVARLSGLVASAAMSEAQVAQTLWQHAPFGSVSLALAEEMAHQLAEAGYALVAVAGPALETVPATASPADTAPEAQRWLDQIGA